MQQELLHLRPTAVTADGRGWVSTPFQVQAAYRKLLRANTEGEADIAKACQRIWKFKVPLKVRLFSWLLLKRRLVTCAHQRKWQPDAPIEFIMCNGITKDVPHLFFNCAFARRVWENQQITGLDISSVERFWSSIGRYRGRGALVLVRAWAVL